MDYINIALCQADGFGYPGKEELFRPSEAYAEYPFSDELAKKENTVYKAVRESFHLLRMDEKHYGTSEWNPLGELIMPGNKVLIKPNMVMDVNPSGGGVECLYTQPGVVAAVIDYVVIALRGKGQIIVGDAPMQECKFEKLIEESGYRQLIEYYRAKGVDIKLVDFRGLKTEVIGGIRHQTIEQSNSGTVIDLKEESEFSICDEQQMGRLRVTNYSPDRLRAHHTVDRHEYYVSNHVLEADVIINMPKPKTHRKAGVTIALKNLVGINVRKEFLPHHAMGSQAEGGDEYNRQNIWRCLSGKFYDKKNMYEGRGKYLLARIFFILGFSLKGLTRCICHDEAEGNWYGNHTISKTIVDLNKIMLYADKSGKMQKQAQRKIFNIGDMIISGEKEGPVKPEPKKVGYIISGCNSVNFDKIVATMMGADIQQIPTLQNAEEMNGELSIKSEQEPLIISNNCNLSGKGVKDLRTQDKWNFVSTRGWKKIFL